jgi:maltose-binding protein MalE
MNRSIAAFAIAAVAALGLTACSGGAAEDTSNDSATSNESAPAENSDQSVEEACGIVLPKLQEASTAAGDIDTSGATDPQTTVDQFDTVVAAFGEAADSVSNAEVKAATTAVYEDFGSLSEILSKVLVDQDMSAASDLSTITSDMTESATALQKLCS